MRRVRFVSIGVLRKLTGDFKVMTRVRPIITVLTTLSLLILSNGCGGGSTRKSGSMDQIKHKFPQPPEQDGNPRPETHRSTGLQRRDLSH